MRAHDAAGADPAARRLGPARACSPSGSTSAASRTTCTAPTSASRCPTPTATRSSPRSAPTATRATPTTRPSPPSSCCCAARSTRDVPVARPLLRRPGARRRAPAARRARAPARAGLDRDRDRRAGARAARARGWSGTTSASRRRRARPRSRARTRRTQAFRHGRHLGVQFHPESTVEIVEHWAASDRERLAALGLGDGATLIAATPEDRAAARAAAFALFDGFLETANDRPPPRPRRGGDDGPERAGGTPAAAVGRVGQLGAGGLSRPARRGAREGRAADRVRPRRPSTASRSAPRSCRPTCATRRCSAARSAFPTWSPGPTSRRSRCCRGSRASPAASPTCTRSPRASRVPADPRGAVRRAVAAYEELGLAPIVGPELEFFLCERDPAAPGGLRRYVDNLSMVYTVGPQADPRGVVRQITESMAGMGMGTFAANHEFMNSQYEINLRHAPALTAADRAFRLKSAVKDVAAQAGMVATFMGKPFNDQGGSGFHLHVSADRDDDNAFSDRGDADGVSDELRRFTAGVLAHAPGADGVPQPDDQRLPADRARLAGADQHQLGLGQPHRVRPHPRRARPRDAGRDPDRRRQRQPVPRDRRDAVRRPARPARRAAAARPGRRRRLHAGGRRRASRHRSRRALDALEADDVPARRDRRRRSSRRSSP